MIVKVLEIRDSMTFIPALAIKLAPRNEEQRYLCSRVGFSADQPGVIVMRLNDQEAHSDSYDWRGDTRTMPNAHVYIEQHFDELRDGDVVDVEFILDERATKKTSERVGG